MMYHLEFVAALFGAIAALVGFGKPHSIAWVAATMFYGLAYLLSVSRTWRIR